MLQAKTQSYHFEPSAGTVSENANRAAPEPAQKRKRVDASADSLAAIAAAMSRNVPARPRNVYKNEQFRA